MKNKVIILIACSMFLCFSVNAGEPEVDEAPSGVELYESHVFDNGTIITLPGRHAGEPTYREGNTTHFDFSTPSGGGGGSLNDTTIHYEMP